MDYYGNGNNNHKISSEFLLANERDTKLPVDEDEERSMKSSRKHSTLCCCCPFWICIGIIVAIIAFIGIMALIFWPKIPDVNIENIQLSEDNPISYKLPAGANSQFGIKLNLDVFVKVHNDNFYDIHIKDINTIIYIQTEELGEKVKVGEGSKTGLKFEKHSDTDITLPVTIGYFVEGADSTLLYLLKACSRNQPINIQYEVEVGLTLVEVLYKPKFQGTRTFQCPDTGIFSGDISNILMGDVYSSISDYLSNFIGV